MFITFLKFDLQFSIWIILCKLLLDIRHIFCYQSISHITTHILLRAYYLIYPIVAQKIALYNILSDLAQCGLGCVSSYICSLAYVG